MGGFYLFMSFRSLFVGVPNLFSTWMFPWVAEFDWFFNCTWWWTEGGCLVGRKPIDHWTWSTDFKWVCWSNFYLYGVKLSFSWFQWIKWFFTLNIDFRLGQRMLTRFLCRFLVWVIPRELVLMRFFYYHDNYRARLSH